MGRTRRFHNTFITGQVSESLRERYDFEKREGALARLVNARIRPQGGLVRRDGSRFVAAAKNANERVRLIPFAFSRTQAYLLEFGDFYVRFFRDGGRLVDGSSNAIELATPWGISAVQELDFSQDADTLVITHASTATRLLQRWSDTAWTLDFLTFRPPATEEQGFQTTATTLILASLGGNRYSVTATTPIFAKSDIGRLILEQGQDAQGVGLIDTFVNAVGVEITAVETFSKLSLTGDPLGNPSWLLAGSPIANLAIRRTDDGKLADGTQGEFVNCMAFLRELEGATNLISNPDFSGGLADWDDYSHRLIFSGTHQGGAADNFIVDATNQDFRAAGVEPNHLMILGSYAGAIDNAHVASLESSATAAFDKLIPDNTSFTIANTNPYAIHDTSQVTTSADGALMQAGRNGVAWIEQDVVANQRSVYEYEVTVRNFSVSLQIGSTSKTSDVVEEVTLETGTTIVKFTTPNVSSASTMTLYVQLRNNQPDTSPLVENVIVREIAVEAFQIGLEPGDWVRVNDGYINVLEVPEPWYFMGVIQDGLSSVDDGLAGDWTVQKSKFVSNNFPSSAVFYQGRLWLASLLTVRGTKVGIINSLALGTEDSDAVQFEPAATQVNPVHWMIGERQLLLGTRAEEYVVGGTETSFIKPSDIDVISPSAIGSEPVKPLRVEQTVLFVKAGGKRIMEYNFGALGGDNQYRDLSVLVDDLVPIGDRIVQIAFQDEPYQILWCVTQNGLLLSMVYVKEHNVWAWGTHSSADGALFQSVAVIPHPDGDRDQVWLSTKRTSAGESQIGYFDDTGGLAPGTNSITTDGTLRYSGVSTTFIGGLGHLSGLPVYVVDSIGIQGPFTVAGAGVNFPRAITEADVGVGVTVEIETLRPAIEGQGPTGLIIGDTNMFARFRNTGDGVTVRGKVLKLRRPSDLMDSYIEPVSRDVEIPSVGFDRDITVLIEQALPAPFELQSLAGTIQYENP